MGTYGTIPGPTHLFGPEPGRSSQHSGSCSREHTPQGWGPIFPSRCRYLSCLLSLTASEHTCAPIWSPSVRT